MWEDAGENIVKHNTWLLHSYHRREGVLGGCNFISVDEGFIEAVLSDRRSSIHMVCISGDIHFMFGGDVKDHYLNLFQDWTRPTKEENDYFELCYGRRLPWSEEQPFVKNCG